jgi:hypothetical protein
MQKRLFLGVCGVLIAVAGCGGGTAARRTMSTSVRPDRTIETGHGILFLRAAPHLAQNIVLWRPGSTPRPIGSTTDYMQTPQWSPNATAIAYIGKKGGWEMDASWEIWTMSSNGSGAKQITYDHDRYSNVGDLTSPSWSPDSREIAYTRSLADSPNRPLVIVNVASGKERVLARSCDSPAWGKAGIACVDYRGRIVLVSPKSGAVTVLAHDRASLLAWSSRGVLAAVQFPRILYYSARGSLLGGAPFPHGRGFVVGIAWSPSGKQLLVQTSGKRGGLFWSGTPTGDRWRLLPVAEGTTTYNNVGVSWR